MEVYTDLAGASCIKPIDISELELFSDSSCALHWLKSSECELNKMQKVSVFVLNRIASIRRLCDVHSVKFSFISGKDNPADCVTRCLSPKLLAKSCFISGPKLSLQESDFVTVTIPCPEFCVSSNSVSDVVFSEPVVDSSKFSSFRRLVLLYRRVIMCARKWRLKAGLSVEKDTNCFAEAANLIIRSEQHKHFKDVFSYFRIKDPRLVDIPPLVSQFNIFKDSFGILRIKSKFKKWFGNNHSFPILLPSKSYLTNLIIMDVHIQLQHGSFYSVLSELRKKYFIPKNFSVVKNVVKQCLPCRRFNSRTIKLNQSCYKEFRYDPIYSIFLYFC